MHTHTYFKKPGLNYYHYYYFYFQWIKVDFVKSIVCEKKRKVIVHSLMERQIYWKSKFILLLIFYSEFAGGIIKIYYIYFVIYCLFSQFIWFIYTLFLSWIFFVLSFLSWETEIRERESGSFSPSLSLPPLSHNFLHDPVCVRVCVCGGVWWCVAPLFSTH